MILWHAKLSLKKFYSTLQRKSVHRLLDTLGCKKKDFFFSSGWSQVNHNLRALKHTVAKKIAIVVGWSMA